MLQVEKRCHDAGDGDGSWWSKKGSSIAKEKKEGIRLEGYDSAFSLEVLKEECATK
jgi:hypothetical protein